MLVHWDGVVCLSTVMHADYDLDPQWELVADSIKLIREVGEGAFGKVYEGILATIEDGDLTVAVKVHYIIFGIIVVWARGCSSRYSFV